jgi:hypothetical protein
LGQRDENADYFADCFDFTQALKPYVPIVAGTASGYFTPKKSLRAVKAHE